MRPRHHGSLAHWRANAELKSELSHARRGEHKSLQGARWTRRVVTLTVLVLLALVVFDPLGDWTAGVAVLVLLVAAYTIETIWTDREPV